MLELDKVTFWITEGIDVVKRNMAACSLLFLVVLLGSMCTLGLLAGPLLAGYFIILFRLIEDKRSGVVGTPTHPRDLMAGFDYFTNSLLVVCVFIAATILRALIYQITGSGFGIFWSLVFFAILVLLVFAIPLIVTHRLSALDAIKKSCEVVSKHPATFAAFVGCFYILSFLVSYVVITLFWRLGFLAVLLNLTCSWAIGLVFFASIAVAHLEVFGKSDNSKRGS